MKKQTPDKLEQTLAMLSNASDEPAQIWQQALASVNESATTLANRSARSWNRWRIVFRFGFAASFLLAVGITWQIGRHSTSVADFQRRTLESIQRALYIYSNENTQWWPPATPQQFLSPSSGTTEDALRNAGSSGSGYVDFAPADQSRSLGYVGDSASESGGAVAARDGRFENLSRGTGAGGRAGRSAGSFNPAASDAPPPNAARHVIRKASLELRSTHVRALFAKVPLVLNDGLGEFVQDSSLTGTPERPEASLTLRVAADRLSAVLNQLRELGTVASERVTGEDVTGAIVDVEARLQNERRIEKELLELLDKRPDAPLKELLEVRNELSRVRLMIEQLAGQREHLGRLVSLATVLVLVRLPDAKSEQPAEPTTLDYITHTFDSAARTGVRTLIYTVAEIVQILIGGAIWWAILLAALLYIRRRFRAG